MFVNVDIPRGLAYPAPVRINPEALKTIRRDREVALGKLAEAVGITHGHLSNIEAGRSEASPSVIRGLAAELRVDLLALLGPENREAAEATK